MKLIDSHIHLDFDVFDNKREALIVEAQQHGITQFVVPAVTAASWPKLTRLANENAAIRPAFGLHPYFTDEHQNAHINKLDALLARTPAIAVGEIGLDYFLPNLDRGQQQHFFIEQLQLAKAQHLPVILHVRKAVDEVIKHCKQQGVSSGIAHSFNGSAQQAKQLLDMNIKLGFGGAITYSRAKRLRQLIMQLPLSALCIETDAPDQPVQRLNKQVNTPDALLDVFDTVCQLRHEPPEEIAACLYENTLQALQMTPPD